LAKRDIGRNFSGLEGIGKMCPDKALERPVVPAEKRVAQKKSPSLVKAETGSLWGGLR
jgi:hypothetical protein